jgi:(p)ppGpp synthase/HD superfamily hydrolase
LHCMGSNEIEYLFGPNDRNFEQELRHITLAPYIAKARALIGVPGKGGANLFRHQLFTLSVLMDYGITDSILLKAAAIHDLFEDAPELADANIEEEVRRIDADGPAVCALVSELTIRTENNVKEPKSQYLARIMACGSNRAKILKLADRISNVTFLGFVHDMEFVIRYLAETRSDVLPYAKSINQNMHRELTDLVEDRERTLRLIDPGLQNSSDAERSNTGNSREA